MQLPALVVSAVRLSGIPVSRISAEIEINRSVLSRALGGADLPEKYFARLCAAVGLEITGDKWDAHFVDRWRLYTGDKKGTGPTTQDLATALLGVKSPKILRMSFVRGANSLDDYRRIAIANTKPVGDDNSWCVYLVSGGAVRRLLYIEASLRNDAEHVLNSAGKLERKTIDDDLDKKIGDIWEKFSRIHLPNELDNLIALIRAGGPKANLSRDDIKAIKRLAEFTGQTIKELCMKIGIRNYP